MATTLTVGSKATQTVSSLASSTTASTLGNFTLPKGTWEVNVRVKFPANTTGRREIFLSTSNTGSSYGISYDDMRKPVTSGKTVCKFSCYITVTADTVFYVRGYQNSGSALASVTVDVDWIGIPG